MLPAQIEKTILTRAVRHEQRVNSLGVSRLCQLTFPGLVDGFELLFRLVHSSGLNRRRKTQLNVSAE